jgi:hypothetical protein
MNLKDLVIDYEYAVKLKELGFKQKSLFWHVFYKNNPESKTIIMNPYSDSDVENISAFTSDELLEILPKFIEFKENFYNLEIDCVGRRNLENFCIKYNYQIYENFNYLDNEDFRDKKFSNALAKMLIYLIENGYYKIGE